MIDIPFMVFIALLAAMLGLALLSDSRRRGRARLAKRIPTPHEPAS